MTSVAELKKKFAANSTKPTVLTPEQHAAALRQRERDQAEAVRVAKARAARYNLTLRSIELTNAVNNTKAVVDERAKKESTMKQAATYGRRVSNLGKTAQNKVAAQHEAVATAMNHRRNPTVAKEVVEAAAAAVEMQISTEEAKPTLDAAAAAKAEAEAAAIAAAQAEEARILAEELAQKEAAARKAEEERAAAEATVAVVTAAVVTEEVRGVYVRAGLTRLLGLGKMARPPANLSHTTRYGLERGPPPQLTWPQEVKARHDFELTLCQSAPVETGASFEMSNLAEALETGDEAKINEAIVTEFIAEHDPSKLSEVPAMLEENKGNEAGLMKDLAEQYADPVEVEIKVQAEAIAAAVETEPTPPPVKEDEPDDDVIEAQRKEAERVAAEEQARIAAMDEAERETYMETLKQQAAHEEEKDRMLKAQLNVYANGAGGGVNILAGRGRGRGKRPVSGKHANTEYIVSASNTEGEWEVNNE